MSIPGWSQLSGPTFFEVGSGYLGSPDQGSSLLAVCNDMEGRLHLFAVGDGLWHIRELDYPSWAPWQLLAQPAGSKIKLVGPLAADTQRDGRIKVFVGYDNAVPGSSQGTTSRVQTKDLHSWEPWQNFLFTSGSSTSAGAVYMTSAHEESGKMNAIASQGRDGVVRSFETSRYTDASHGWSWITKLAPFHGGIANDIAAAANDDKRLEVFTITDDHHVWHTWQTSPNGPFADWFDEGVPPGDRAYNPCLARNTTDGTLVFLCTNHLGAWKKQQLQKNGSWSDWKMIGGPIGGPIAEIFPSTRPTLAVNGDGRMHLAVQAMEVIGQSAQHYIKQTFQRDPGGEEWVPWATMATLKPEFTMSALASGRFKNGQLALFAINEGILNYRLAGP